MVRSALVGPPRRAGLVAVSIGLVTGASAWVASAPRPFPPSAAGQEGKVTVAAAIEPDTAHVGESVLLGVTVRARDVRSVGFPALLPLTDPLEQKGPIEQRAVTEDGEWRAYYRILAWQAGEQRVPAFEVAVRTADDERRLEVAPGPLFVATVLPTDTAGLQLREARPLLRITGPSWAWLLLAALGVAAWLYWLWRRRSAPAAASVPLTPFEQTLESLRRLRRGWREGRLTAPQLYDGLEVTLRGYAEATRAWRPGASLKRLTNGDRGLATALANSVLVRFARVAPSDATALASIDAGESWVREDAEEREAAGPAESREERDPGTQREDAE
jgi:hypothetical protein